MGSLTTGLARIRWEGDGGGVDGPGKPPPHPRRGGEPVPPFCVHAKPAWENLEGFEKEGKIETSFDIRERPPDLPFFDFPLVLYPKSKS